MENGIFQFIDILLITIFVIVDIIKELMPNVDIVSGVFLFTLLLGVIFLIMKLIEKEIIFKVIFLFILIFVFFGLLKRVEILNEITAYTSSLVVGILLLLTMAGFTSWDEEGEEYT